MDDITKLLDGSVEDVKAGIGGMSRDDLVRLRQAEQDGKTRKGVLEALDTAIGEQPDGDEAARGVEDGPVQPVASGVATAADLDKSGPAHIEPATTFDTAGAPQQIVPDVDVSHPAVDNDPRANTTVNQNRIDFNDPTRDGVEVVTEQLQNRAQA